MTEAQKKATKRYRKQSTHSFSMTFFPKDEALWQWLQNQKSKAEYVRELIRRDMDSSTRMP